MPDQVLFCSSCFEFRNLRRLKKCKTPPTVLKGECRYSLNRSYFKVIRNWPVLIFRSQRLLLPKITPSDNTKWEVRNTEYFSNYLLSNCNCNSSHFCSNHTIKLVFPRNHFIIPTYAKVKIVAHFGTWLKFLVFFKSPFHIVKSLN